ncbi:ABC transporter substrate-binding protein [candidate division KSB1 bacterium]|nr:ABC transporter substrate-binding protein [candidate division KSB1 bacterium]NIR70473.1 ABC transporter substrate-binding protein [candidate division KSB1 bacterium]NIS27651.1 ABC transporter substrate-binding protein [candidate division KSB1 bacterium]NIT74486.1 ABC transporter substrate-binding protein [candidate division KSB1 bacterium]NIU28332.1 ABC transporter substrate-binding protein [candidate division KSB1 bacterium]
MHEKGLLKILLGLGFILLCLDPTSYAQSQQWKSVKVLPNKEAQFRQALREYSSEKYRAAFDDFEALATSRELHQRMTASLLMTGKSLYQLGRYSDAIPYFDKLITTFPRSKYIDDAYYEKGISHYRLGNYSDAVVNLLGSADWSSENALIAGSKKLARYLMRSELSLQEMRDLTQFANGEHSAALITIEMAQKELREGSTERAISLLKDYKKKYGSKQYLPTVDRLLKEAETSGGRPMKVGVILPLSGYFAEEGMGVLRGVKFAQAHGKNNDDTPIRLEIWDSESNMVKAIRGVNTLVERAKVDVIIGELESPITAGIGALASLKKVPVIGPAATENGVTTVGESVFQLNSTLETKGQALAEYAFHVLGLRTFATLAPADEYGQQMTDSFMAKIDELGGRIVAQSWYYAGSEDLNLTRQFNNIRESAFAYDSTDVEELIKEAERKGEDLEEKDIPVLSIDGIFFPIYSEDIPYVAPQFALSNIRAQVLGGEYWDNLEVLSGSQVQPYVNAAIFVSDYFPNDDSIEFRNFRNEFRMAMRTTPERWEVFGYDALNVLEEVLKTGAKRGVEISRELQSLSDFKGMKGEITFKGNNRVNKEVNFLQFLNGKIMKHQNSSN